MAAVAAAVGGGRRREPRFAGVSVELGVQQEV